MVEYKKIQTPLPKVENGEDLLIKDVPFYGDMLFKPVIIEWNGNLPNPFYNDDDFKSVEYYLTKQNPNRESKDKNSTILTTLFDQHPQLKTPENLKLPLGKFALKLKTDHSDINITVGKSQKTYPAYKTLVNTSGGEDDYVSFKVKNLTKEKGLYIWVVDEKPEYVGIAASPRGLNNRINNEYGKVTPYKCSIDGQSQTCRSNSKLRNEYGAKKSISLYVCPIDVNYWLKDPKFMESFNTAGFKGTRPEKNVLEVFEKFIIEDSNLKDGGWNRRNEGLGLVIKEILQTKKLKLPSNN